MVELYCEVTVGCNPRLEPLHPDSDQLAVRLLLDLRAGAGRRSLVLVRERRRARPVLPGVRAGARDRASPNFMGPASLGLEIGIFCNFLYSDLLLKAISGLDFLRLALSRPQVRGPQPDRRPRRAGAHRAAAPADGRGDASPGR